MMPYVNVILTGICAFTPAAPDYPNTVVSGRGITIVMPSSKRRVSSHPATLGTPIPVHSPFIVLNGENVPTEMTGRRADWPNTAAGRYVWLLNRERVRFTLPQASDVTFVRTGPTHKKAPNGDEKDVYWIADMRQIWHERQYIRPEYVQMSGDIDNNVNAQFLLTGGEISSGLTVGPYTIVDFDPVKTDIIDHTLTRWVKLKFNLGNQNSFTIQTSSLSGGADLGSIDVFVKDNKDIDMYIGNASLQDIVAIGNDNPTQSHLGYDIHFELYYDVLHDNGALPITLPDEALQSSHSNCPPLMTA